jgi:RNA-splicing ligase RtcB
MPRLLSQKRQHEKLQITRRKLAPHTHTAATRAAVFHESAPKAAKAVAAVIVTSHEMVSKAGKPV